MQVITTYPLYFYILIVGFCILDDVDATMLIRLQCDLGARVIIDLYQLRNQVPHSKCPRFLLWFLVPRRCKKYQGYQQVVVILLELSI